MSQQVYTFKKDNMGWFIDMPHPHPFSRGALAMVAGADTFLDILSQGEDSVTLALSTEDVEGYERLYRTELIGGLVGSVVNGAMYKILNYTGIEYNHEMWLCPVTLWVFNGKYPEIIYFTKF